VDTDVIDLTDEEPGPAEQDTSNRTAERQEVAGASGAPQARGLGLFGRVLRGRHHDPGTGQT
jgi:hypothetical protein